MILKTFHELNTKVATDPNVRTATAECWWDWDESAARTLWNAEIPGF